VDAVAGGAARTGRTPAEHDRVAVEEKLGRRLLGDCEGDPVAADEGDPSENVNSGKAEESNRAHHENRESRTFDWSSQKWDEIERFIVLIVARASFRLGISREQSKIISDLSPHMHLIGMMPCIIGTEPIATGDVRRDHSASRTTALALLVW
jgi:hypothetical protein